MIVQFVILLAIPLGEILAIGMRRARQSGDAWRSALDRRRRKFARFAYRRSAFYRRLWNASGASPDNPGTLPVVAREDWRVAPLDDVMPNIPRWLLFWRRTGGTAGQPVYVPKTIGDEWRFRATVMAAARDNGARWTDRVLVLLPPRSGHPAGRRLLGRELLIAPDATPQERLDALLRGGYHQLRSTPSVLWQVVVLALRQSISLPPVRLVFTGDEVLTRAVRRTIERALATRVVNHYGATDMGYVAEDCPRGRLHMLSHSAHLEILRDGQPALPGEEGEVVVTNLLSRAQPVVRVRSGDWAAWGPQPCPCGSRIPHLAYVAGRLSDRVVTPDGATVTWPAVEDALAAQGDNLLGVQTEQTARDRVLVRMALLSPLGSLSEIRSALDALFGGLSVEVSLTDEFRAEPNGKVRAVIGLPD